MDAEEPDKFDEDSALGEDNEEGQKCQPSSFLSSLLSWNVSAPPRPVMLKPLSLVQPPRGDRAAAAAACRHGRLAVAGRYVGCLRRLEKDLELLPRAALGDGMSGHVRLAAFRGPPQAIGREGARGRACAVKTLRKRGVTDKRRLEINSEVEFCLSVDHPHIANLERVYETDDAIHLVMEYLEGGELWAKLQECHTFDEPTAAAVFRQMLLAVAYIHELGLVHCDIKPENFMYQSSGAGNIGHLKLIDFGLSQRLPEESNSHDTFFIGEPEANADVADGSKAASDSKASADASGRAATPQRRKLSKRCGSIPYVAPEVLARAYDEKADMWSLGVCLYKMMCGQSPWRGTREQIARRIKAGEPYFQPSLWNRLSDGARSLIEGLMTADPSERLSATSALQHPWLMGHCPPTASPGNASALLDLQHFYRQPPLRKTLLTAASWSLAPRTLEEFASQFLACGDCDITYSEFIAAAAIAQGQGPDDETCWLTFSRFDTKRRGYLCQEDISAAFGESPTSELLAGGGRLSFEDFSAYMRGTEELHVGACGGEVPSVLSSLSTCDASSSDSGYSDGSSGAADDPAGFGS